MNKLYVQPAEGLKVRSEDGSRHLKNAGQSVPATTYYRRRIRAGDLVEVENRPLTEEERLIEAVRALDRDDAGHFTEGGLPSLNHLSDVLGRRVTRAEAEKALAAVTGE